MKAVIILIIFLLPYLSSLGQKNEDLSILETDNSWKKEVFNFPLSFAPGIHFKGIEEARFPGGWADSLSNNFWSYAFAWKIENDIAMTEKELEENLKKYFDGLMAVQNTKISFLITSHDFDTTMYSGSIKTFDAFFTKKPITLIVKATHFYCNEKKMNFILFKFSPKEYENKVWLKLDEATIRRNICEP